jgi:hypothetical protein
LIQQPASTKPPQQSIAFQKAQAALNLQQQQNKYPKVQISSNPRIAPNAGGLGTTKGTQKPAYVSVTAKQSSSSNTTDDVADATLQVRRISFRIRFDFVVYLSLCFFWVLVPR